MSFRPHLQRGRMTHEDMERRSDVRMASDRAFGLVIATAAVLLGLWPALHHKPIRWPALAAASAFALAAALRPPVLHPLNRLWTALAVLLNRVTTPLVCGLLFYLVVTPVAVVLRICGKDPLRLRPDPQSATYWIDRQPEPGGTPPRESMRLQF